jgi:hypothetical protein
VTLRGAVVHFCHPRARSLRQLFCASRSLSRRTDELATLVGSGPLMHRPQRFVWIPSLLLLAACGPADPGYALAVPKAAPRAFQAADVGLPQPSQSQPRPQSQPKPQKWTSKSPSARTVGYTAPRQNFVEANVPPPTRFAFEAQKADPVAQALTLLARESESSSPDPQIAGKGMQAVAAARSVVQANAAAALKLVLASLAKLPVDDVEAHTIAFGLLGELDTQAEAVKLLGDRLMQGQPRAVQPRPAIPGKQPSEGIDPQALIRQAAIRQLFRAARSGRPTASDALLKALASPHAEVRVSAVQFNYALIPGRLAAKAKMRRYLAPAHRYLLNHY